MTHYGNTRDKTRNQNFITSFENLRYKTPYKLSLRNKKNIASCQWWLDFAYKILKKNENYSILFQSRNLKISSSD